MVLCICVRNIIMYVCMSITAPQDAHKKLVLQVAEWLTAGFKGGARHELTNKKSAAQF